MRHHTRALAALAGTVLAASTAAGCSSGAPRSSPQTGGASPTAGGTRVPTVGDLPEAAVQASTPATTVSTRTVPLGKVLVDDKGLTLYLFEKDTKNMSACTGSCAKVWPPMAATGKPTAGPGVQGKLLSTFKRGGSTTQVTYDGHPLYRFSGDKKPGQTNGQGLSLFGAKWYVLGTDGKAITKTAPKSPSPSGSATKPGGY